MRKHFLRIVFLFIFFVCPLVVKADFGDLRYEITDVNISDSKITFKGWAFIHKTNNFVEVTTTDGVKYGGQKIRMQAIDSDTGNVLATKTVDGSDKVNYNFYCEMFYDGWGDSDGDGDAETLYSCLNDNKTENSSYYKNYEYNSCTGDDGVFSQCYYEDIYFSITFDTSSWGISSDKKIKFRIAASNNFFEAKYDGKYTGAITDGVDTYTRWDDVSVSETVGIRDYETDYINIDSASVSSKVKFIASQGLLWDITDKTDYFYYSSEGKGGCAYAAWSEVSTDNNYYVDTGYGTNGRVNDYKECYSFLGNDCIGSGFYALKVANYSTNYDAYGCSIANTITETDSKNGNYYSVWAHVSHVKPTGTFNISVKNDKKCPVTNPAPSNLVCNDSGDFSSTCDELTVHTASGSATVEIVQSGTVSSVLTPNKIYAGGGFNFGILYTNTIKWGYVSRPAGIVHLDVKEVMNNKIIDYESYIAGINVNLKIGDETVRMVKQCTSSNMTDFTYYQTYLTVSCLFTIPKSEIDLNGKVNYFYDAGTVNINNKYYTDIDYAGDYNLTIDIVGMDRIKESVAKSDSKVNGTKWTGDWSDSITNCKVSTYKLLNSPNFIYRPIDIFNPFPNRNAGINWFDWYNVRRNRERLENTYSNVDYTVTLDNRAISDIKNYNDGRNYLDWDSIDEVTKESSFITEKSYIVRGGS